MSTSSSSSVTENSKDMTSSSSSSYSTSQTENSSSSDEPDEEPNMDVLNKLDTILEKDDVLFVISDDKQKKQEDHICPGRLMTKNSYNHLHGQIISSTDMVGDCCGQKSKNNDSYTMYMNPRGDNKANMLTYKNICSDDGLCSSLFSNPRKCLSDWKSICRTYRSKDDLEIIHNKAKQCMPSCKPPKNKKILNADDILNDWKQKNGSNYKEYENNNFSCPRSSSPNNNDYCKPSKKYVSYLSETLKKLQNYDIDQRASPCLKRDKKSKGCCKKIIEEENKLECNTCQQEKRMKKSRKDQMIESKKQLKSFLQSKQRGKYVYCSRIFYPGIKCGHKCCKTGSRAVPSHMGWNWNADSRSKKGWRPGAIPKKIKEIMCHFLSPCPCDTLPVTKKCNKNKHAIDEDKEDDTCEQKPTLSVQKKDGDYLITMRPLKNTCELRNNPNPYLTAKPIKFKISRRAEEKKLDEIQVFLKKKGFRPCTCGNIVACCICRDNKEMDTLRKCLNECEEIYDIKSLDYKLCLKDALPDQKLNIEFTPPAGIVNKNIKKLPDLVYQETQYNEDDFKIIPEQEYNGKSGGKNRSFDKSGKLGAGFGSNKSGIGGNKAGMGSNKSGIGLNKSGVGLTKSGIELNKSGKPDAKKLDGKAGGKNNVDKPGVMNKNNGKSGQLGGGGGGGGAGSSNNKPTTGSNKIGGNKSVK